MKERGVALSISTLVVLVALLVVIVAVGGLLNSSEESMIDPESQIYNLTESISPRFADMMWGEKEEDPDCVECQDDDHCPSRNYECNDDNLCIIPEDQQVEAGLGCQPEGDYGCYGACEPYSREGTCYHGSQCKNFGTSADPDCRCEWEEEDNDRPCCPADDEVPDCTGAGWDGCKTI